MQPLALIFVIAAFFLVLERLVPGRELPRAPGWYARAVLLNAAQLGIVVLAGYTWSQWLRGPSIFNLAGAVPPIAEGFICWFVGTFVFYWWHRARHASTFLWRSLHQIHHSASRIEILTAFYKHPIEIAANSILASTIIYVLLGASVEGGAWYNVFAAVGEFYYHANLRTPRWTAFFIQRPEQHSIHHQFAVHHYNFGDITWWDRLFGTFRETDTFAERCGYEEPREQYLGRMLLGSDVNRNDV
jgi:sterol desaturase/sphingolipid hydroxylase (fatty acid hydroxylase superfamily)